MAKSDHQMEEYEANVKSIDKQTDEYLGKYEWFSNGWF